MSSLSLSPRRSTHTVHVGNLTIGGDAPIRIQSMATVSTLDTEAAVAQAIRLINAGAELVRFTTQGTREAENLRHIKAALIERGYNTPLVADVHFNATVADTAALYADKVRINPGNYVDTARKFVQLSYSDEAYAAEVERIGKRLVPFLRLCREHGTAVRIGVNHGSLSDRILSRYGDTPEGVVESCMEFLRVCQREHFDDVVVSIKASNTVVMVQSVRLLVKAMDAEDMHYPLHLGVTEAGEGEDGRLKSAVGIGTLLTEGIGDTIRVSLAEAPEAELPVAREIVEVSRSEEREGERVLSRSEDSMSYSRNEEREGERVEIDGSTIVVTSDENDWERMLLHTAINVGGLLLDRRATELVIRNPHFEEERLRGLSDDILQAARVKFTKTEYIACPGCGRTLYDLPSTLRRIKEATQHLKGLKIAVMGCIVNGPGEMADADYGYVGAGRGKVSLYRGKECVLKNIPEEEAVERLLEIIEKLKD